MTPDVVHQLARRSGYQGSTGVPPHTVWARCGQTMELLPAQALPAHVTGAASKVTCPGCLANRPWAEVGIPA